MRCHVCTGCGLCPGIARKNGDSGNLHVLLEDVFSGGKALAGDKRRLAVADVGTTTVAMLLYERDGSVAERYVTPNPQRSYGADVISRIRAAQEPSAAEDMRRLIRKVLLSGLERFAGRIAPNEELFLILAANTTMTYLLMGWNPEELGRAPFRAEHLQALTTRLGGVPCFVFPGVSAFVGGDIVSGMYACKMAQKEEITLLVDLGTNGELVLGNSRRRIACATAAGPAFEGGATGGIWGADMISLLATLRQKGFLDETGLLAEPFFERGVRIGNVLVTKEAVRSVQLAKAAIAAGVEILMEKYKVTPSQIDRVVLAGGFGYYLKPQAAAQIGLLPPPLVEKTVSGGNTALSGGLRLGRELLCGKGLAEAAGEQEKSAAETESFTLAEEAGFKEKYIRLLDLKPMPQPETAAQGAAQVICGENM